MRRMDRYNDEPIGIKKRYKKNQELYHDVANNTKYTNITDVTNANAYEISKNYSNTHSSRESYHQMRKYQNVEPVPKVKKELADFNYLYKNKERKVYDINSVLEEARKNRKEQDSLEEKRKLKNTSYNILADLNKEELEKYRQEKKNKIMTPEEEEFRDLIDTIASKTLAGEIDKATSINLLSDLMATSVMDKVDAPSDINEEEEREEKLEEKEKITKEESSEEKKENISKNQEENQKATDKSSLSIAELQEIEKQNKHIDSKSEKLAGADKDFYTRSMDLSDEDFEMDDEFKDKGVPLVVKIIILMIIIGLIAAAVYFIYQRM